jgi:hypothetical protein
MGGSIQHNGRWSDATGRDTPCSSSHDIFIRDVRTFMRRFFFKFKLDHCLRGGMVLAEGQAQL